MKKLISIVTATLVLSSLSYATVNSQEAVNTFKTEIQHIKEGLQGKKLTPMEAQVLLLAIQARENEVIIEQNAEMIKNQQSIIQKLGTK